jgi:DNA helicase-2/ATP-dependent DNA helicase PcrA
LEITEFAQRISRNPNIIPMERHGEVPAIKMFTNNAEEIAYIQSEILRFKDSAHQTMGIICKTQEQANKIHHELKSPGIHLLSADSTSYTRGVIIATVHLAKGLEFDQVIVPFASVNNYHTGVDKSMLYIACTRAMHQLTLTCSKEKSSFIA